MRVAIVENMDATGLGTVGAALSGADAEIAVFRPWQDDPLPAPDSEFDGLVVFGGEQNAVDDAAHPYLPALAGLMRDYVESGRAVLGICLGGQMLARAFGGRNIIGGASEFGWKEIALTEDGEADPVLSAAGSSFSSFQWHDDTFTLPAGATRLAGNSSVMNQAFRIGRAGYATQFHFEADRALVKEWSAHFAKAVARHDPDFMQHYETLSDTLGRQADQAGLALARAWVKTI
ncbi:type 1 glutamine amidotransferase [Martelella sp. HB161492]|uniref:type 1 glutamine amidotransferase n=1 Tax=Martelella sp. HB161492 TaxID=2720726 RepID=UPI0015919F9E|nr:type 1 glutamine amidotransferase [Martelella sp. HB161492]